MQKDRGFCISHFTGTKDSSIREPRKFPFATSRSTFIILAGQESPYFRLTVLLCSYFPRAPAERDWRELEYEDEKPREGPLRMIIPV